MSTGPTSSVHKRAIDVIRKRWGSLSDLPQPIIPVVWVTVYRGLEMGMKIEAAGGQRAFDEEHAHR